MTMIEIKRLDFIQHWESIAVAKMTLFHLHELNQYKACYLMQMMAELCIGLTERIHEIN